jgi:hypothetical protein
MIFSTRTNWKRSYDILNGYYTVSEAKNRALFEEITKVKNESDASLKKLSDEMALLKADRDEKVKIADAAKKELEEMTTKVKLNQVGNDSLTAELERRKQEVEKLMGIVQTREQKILALEKDAKKLLDDFLKADIAYKSAAERNRQLLENLELITKENERLKSGVASAGSSVAKRPPPEDVEGIITETDLKNGLVTLSIGSDAGLSKGNTLEIYRLKPEAKYLGSLRIIDVNPHEAVGRPLDPNKAKLIQKGDIVAANIIAGR